MLKDLGGSFVVVWWEVLGRCGWVWGLFAGGASDSSRDDRGRGGSCGANGDTGGEGLVVVAEAVRGREG